MITQLELDNAAFWDQLLCLICGASQATGEDTPFGHEEGCESELVFPATLLQEIQLHLPRRGNGDDE